jgi:hypothetical protein
MKKDKRWELWGMIQLQITGGQVAGPPGIANVVGETIYGKILMRRRRCG